MSSPKDSTALHDQMLGELAGLAMDLARDCAGRAKEAEAPAEREQLILSFERMARSVRLSIVLQRRLHRDIRADRAEAVETRRQQLRAAVLPAVRAAARSIVERMDREKELDEALAADALYEAFLQVPLPTAIARLRERLGLPAEHPANDAAEASEREQPFKRAGPS